MAASDRDVKAVPAVVLKGTLALQPTRLGNADGTGPGGTRKGRGLTVGRRFPKTHSKRPMSPLTTKSAALVPGRGKPLLLPAIVATLLGLGSPDDSLSQSVPIWQAEADPQLSMGRPRAPTSTCSIMSGTPPGSRMEPSSSPCTSGTCSSSATTTRLASTSPRPGITATGPLKWVVPDSVASPDSPGTP